MNDFALIGAAGYIAPRHMETIHSLGHNLLAVCDPSDSVGVLDRWFPHADYYDNDMDMLYRLSDQLGVDYHVEKPITVVVCSPNHKHLQHIDLSLRYGYDVICEKPLVTSTEQLALLEHELTKHSSKLSTIMQLRCHQPFIDLRDTVRSSDKSHRVEVEYTTPRGKWYSQSWKGKKHLSGGIALNIGIHLFDLLLWVFGKCNRSSVLLPPGPTMMEGMLDLDHAYVTWKLSTEGTVPRRVIRVDGKVLDFTTDFTYLHQAAYRHIESEGGYSIDDVRPAIELVESLKS